MSQLDALRTAILSLDGPVFAVLDGAQFENLSQTLMFAGIEARCLYLDRGDNHPERLVTAPYMVGPLEGATLDRVLSALPKTSAAVFWECPDGADALYRHLRGINMVRISSTTESQSGSPERDPVLLRHADANVMAQLLPMLPASGVSRLVGPAVAVFFLPAREWRDNPEKPAVRILRKDEDWPQASREMLQIGPASIDGMRDTRRIALRSKRLENLRRSSPSLFENVPDNDVAAWAENHERSGRAIGLKTERGLLQWTYLMGGSQGRFIEDPRIRDHLTKGYGTPDHKLDRLMATMVEASRDERR